MQEEVDNGIVPSMAAVTRAQYESRREVQREFMRESEEIRNHYLALLDELRRERLKLREQASFHAGKLGLAYSADTNSFARLVIADNLPDVTPPKDPLRSPPHEFQGLPPLAPEEVQDAEFLDLPLMGEDGATLEDKNSNINPQVAPAAHSAPRGDERKDNEETVESRLQRPTLPPFPEPPQMVLTTEPHSDKSWRDVVGKGFAWVFAVLIGMFVGYGFDKMLELSKYNFTTGTGNLLLLTLLLLIGVSLICGLKLLLEIAWKSYGEAKRYGNASAGWFRGVAAITGAFIVVEAAVTYMAFEVYLKAVTLDGQSPIPAWALFLMAFGVASPNLLFSAFSGYAKGIRTHSQAELDRKQNAVAMDAYYAERARLQLVYDEEMEIWRARQAAEDKLAQAKADRLEELKNLHHQLEVDKVHGSQEVQKAWLEHQLAIFIKRGELAEGSMNHLEERREKLETFRNEPDFQALNECIGKINSLTQEMNELREAMNHRMISREISAKGVI